MGDEIGAEKGVVEIDLHVHSGSQSGGGGIGSVVPELRSVSIDEAADSLRAALLEGD